LHFNDKLKVLIKIFNINSRKLANAIHVDPSSVSRWLNGKRIPSHDSEIVNKMIDFLINLDLFEYQKNQFYQLLNISVTEIEKQNIDLRKTLKEWIYSPENVVVKPIKTIGLVKNDAQGIVLNNLISNISGAAINYQNRINVEDYTFFTGKMKEVEVFYGINGIRNALLYMASDLLKQKFPGQLIITSIDNFFWYDNSGFLELWIELIKKLIEKDHKVKVLYNLRRGLPEIAQLLSVLLPLITTGKFEAYFYPDYIENVLGITLAAVPGRSAILSVLSEDENLYGNTFLYKDYATVEYMATKVDKLIHFSKQLFYIYTNQNMLIYLQDIHILEESLNSRFVCRNGLTSLTIPLHLYKKLLNKSNLNKTQIQKRYELHKKRLETLKTNRNTHFMDICFIEAIDKMIDKNGFEYFLVDIFASGVVYAEPNDVIEHLKNTVEMLKNIDNFEIALVEKHEFFGGNSMYWAVMEDKAAIFSTWDPEGNPTCVMIRELSVVNECENYFRTKWNNILHKNKSKSWVISQINSKIKKLEKIVYRKN
jgi:hypothetical protein